jgi:tRNA 2-selenouridine synthase SelU
MLKNRLFELNDINFINYLIIKEDRQKISEQKLINTRTRKILAVKDGENAYVDEIISWAINEIEKMPLIIIPYPSTNKDKDVSQQLPNIIVSRMHEEYKEWEDGGGYLFRKYSLPKNTRNEIEQYKSLIIQNKNVLQNKNILLLDDVTTSGSSLRAGLKILAQANPKQLQAIAIAKKVYLKDIPLTGIY